MKFILMLSSILLVLSACTEETPQQTMQQKKKEVPFVSKEVFLSDINVLLKIPTTYYGTKIEDYYNLSDTLLSTEEEQQFKIDKIQQIKTSPFSYKIFIDSTNIDNSIWVLYGKFLPHIPINKETAPQAVALIKAQLKSIGDINHTFTEQKLGKLKHFSYIKMKAISQTSFSQKYISLYLISSPRKTFMLKIINAKDIDLQEYINQTVFRNQM